MKAEKAYLWALAVVMVGGPMGLYLLAGSSNRIVPWLAGHSLAATGIAVAVLYGFVRLFRMAGHG